MGYLAQERLAHQTVKGYLLAVRYLQISGSFSAPFQQAQPKLEYTLKKIKKPRQRIQTGIARLICQWLQGSYGTCVRYRIAGKFGGNYICQNGLQVEQNKYWQNLNLAFGLFGNPYAVHGRVSTRDLCSGPLHIQKQMDSTVGKVLQCKIENCNIHDRSMPTPEAYSCCTCLAN